METAENAPVKEKKMVTDIFVDGARKGWQIATSNTVPNVLMAFVVIYALQITGLMDFLGSVFAPAMALFGLPGEAAMVLFAAWMSMGGGVGVASSLFLTGKLTATNVAILAPAMYLMGSQLQFMGRLLGVTGTKGKYYPAMFAICVLNALIALWIMNLIV
jgi:spore maturation protein SpmB